MGEGALETLLKRDRLIVGLALGILTLLAWIYLAWLSQHTTMSGMPDMPGMDMVSPGPRAWSVADFAFTLVMWAVMMVGMMTPSVAPMVLLYSRVARQTPFRGQPFAASGWFAGGYLLSWIVFSLAATILQGLLEQAALLTPTMALASQRLGGIVLIAAGVYQWTPLKNSCLKHCRAPLSFIQSHGGFKKEAIGSVVLGFRHGIYCVGCCWLLMALLFAGGVMNIAWIAAIAIFVLVEKVVPGGPVIARVAGAAFATAGLWFLVA